MTVQEAIQHRRSVRVYDSSQKIASDTVRKCLEQASLSPNSSNMQLWEFHHVISKEKRDQMTAACLHQNAASTAQELVVIVVRKDLWKQRVKTHIHHLKNTFGNKQAADYSRREKFALNYYQKLIPFVYRDFLGVFGQLKYIAALFIGFFRPIYRQLRRSDIRIVAHKSAGIAAQTFMLSMAAEGYDTCPMEGIDSLKVKKILHLPLKSEINMVISCGIRKPEGIYGERFRIPFNNVYKTW